MKKIYLSIFLIVFIIGLLIPNQCVSASSMENGYLGIKLTSPIKLKNSIKLYSENGFSIYRKDDILNELEHFEDQYISISIGEEGNIIVLDSFNNNLFSFREDGLVLSSGDVYDKRIKIEDKSYRDYVFFKRQGNEIIVINYVKMDNYLYGVVPREMPASFPVESLKAQSISARTYTLFNINKHSGEGYNLCDTTHCQVYGGIDGENERTNGAVDDTSGMIITYNGNIIDATYHSNSGGYTEDASEVWGNSVPYLSAVNDEFSQGSPNSTWSFSMTCAEVDARLKNSGISIGNIVNMEVLETSSNGRVSKLKVVGTVGETVLNKDKIRQVLGSTELKSTWFTIKRDGNGTNVKTIYAVDGENINPQIVNLSESNIIDGELKKTPSRDIGSRAINRDNVTQIGDEKSSNTGNFIIEGKGYGHGVGMSQWGAKGMAELGYSCEEILKHYYTGIDIITQY